MLKRKAKKQQRRKSPAQRGGSPVKAQTKPRKIREARTVIVSFRLRQSEADMLKKELKQAPIAGVKSVKQYARKLTIDHALGRTAYIDPMDYKISPDSRKDLLIVPPNCQIEDPQFRKALTDFLNTPENWRKLRLFMLLAGWPVNLLERYKVAETEQERLLLAQQVLQDMSPIK